MRTLIAVLLLAKPCLSPASHSGIDAGRFRVVQISEFRRDQFLIDTETGRLWARVCTNGDPNAEGYCYWKPEDVLGINATPKAIGNNIKLQNILETAGKNAEEKTKPDPLKASPGNVFDDVAK